MTARCALDRTVRLVRDAVPDEVSDEVIVDRFQALRVRCIADQANVSSHSGQTALVTLVSLIARMGVQIDLDVPDVELTGPQPPLRGTRLRQGLIDLGGDLVPGTTVTCDPGAPYDLTFVLGDTRVSPEGWGWRLTGTAWAGSITGIDSAGSPWNARMPIGGMTAAALAAPEVFKFAIRSLPFRHPFWAELLAQCQSATWDFEGEGLVLPGEPVAVDFISAGAITQAALFALFRLPLRLRGRLFDNDVAELSNVNRQTLLRRSDTGPKVNIVAGAAPATYNCTPVAENFCLSASPRHLPLPPHVLVGVDDIPARWDAQRAAQGWLGVGGTTHFQASVSSHEPGQPCAGCLHPRTDALDGDAPIPTVSFVSFWAGLALAVRLLRHVGGTRYDARRQHLWLSPLRMDEQNAGLWRPVAARSDCPVRCDASVELAGPVGGVSAPE